VEGLAFSRTHGRKDFFKLLANNVVAVAHNVVGEKVEKRRKRVEYCPRQA
jgi:hypothetical protein